MTVGKVGRFNKVNQIYKGFDRVHNLDKKLQNLKKTLTKSLKFTRIYYIALTSQNLTYW